jgi:hypothetical protein
MIIILLSISHSYMIMNTLSSFKYIAVLHTRLKVVVVVFSSATKTWRTFVLFSFSALPCMRHYQRVITWVLRALMINCDLELRRSHFRVKRFAFATCQLITARIDHFFCPRPFRQCRLIIELARQSYTRAEIKSAAIVKWTVGMMVSVLGGREERPVSGQSCVIGKSIKTVYF